MGPRARYVAIVVTVALAAGCRPGPRPSRPDLPPVDASLRPEIDRFAAALERYAGGRRVVTDDPPVMLFARALSVTVTNYLEPVTAAALVDTAIAGIGGAAGDTAPADLMAVAEAGITAMMASLDQSSYLGGALYRDLTRLAAGERGSVGVEVSLRDQVLRIVAPLEGGPAARAGLRPGDRLLAIDGEPTAGQSLVRVIQRLRGPIGSEVTLAVERRGGSGESVVRLVRERVEIRVTSRRLPTGHGYVRLNPMGERTDQELEEALRSFDDGADSLPGLVLDLRDNPGGLVVQAVRVTDRFLDSGLIVSTDGRVATQKQAYFARKVGTWGPIPMAVLVNGGTAAGAEILAAALQYHARARVVGTRTFGLGTIATVFPISGDEALRLATARAYAPSGRPISEGVVPDVVVEGTADETPSPTDVVSMRAVELLSASAAAR